MVQVSELKEHWRRAAPHWREHGDLVRETTEPVSRALVDAAGPTPGETWLDVAGGVGDPAALIPERVGAEGTVVVSDLIPDMVISARAIMSNATTHVNAVAAAAEALPFRPVFHGVTCRFGAMFFADPERAFESIRGVVIPGGRGVFAVWRGREKNPYFTEVISAVREIVPDVPTPEPDEPHVFRYAPSGKLASLMRGAGWIDVEERDLPFTMAAEIKHHEFWDRFVGLSSELRALVEDLPGDRQGLLRAAVEDRVAPYFPEESMRMPAVAVLVIAHAP